MHNKKMLYISKDLSLPLDAVTQTFAILAKKRRGKTYTGSVMAEEMVEAGLPWVVIDPTGAWWGLRASADGKKPGYPVTIIGGDHGDIPLEYTAGAVIADLVVEHPGHYILDLSLLESNAQQDRFCTDFAERLYRIKATKRFPMHLYVDEADTVVPQQPMPEQRRMLGAFDTLVRRGGIRGIGITLISQRPAVVNKNVLSQVECLIVLQIVGSQDREAIEKWVKAHDLEEVADKLVKGLASLGLGEAWVWSPAWLNIFKPVKIRERRTFNSSKTPEVGDELVQPKVLAKVDLEAIKTKVAATIEKAKSNDPKALRQELQRLHLELAKKTQSIRPLPAPEPKVVKVEVPVLREADLKRIERVSETVKDTVAKLLSFVATLEGVKRQATAPPLLVPAPPCESFAKRPMPKGLRDAVFSQGSDGIAREVGTNGNGELLAGQRRMLNALARSFPLKLTRTQLGTLVGVTATSGTFRNYFGGLKRGGYLTEQGDLVLLTQKGTEEADVKPGASPATPEETIAMWRDRLLSGERKMLDVLVKMYPEAATREYLGVTVGIRHTSGTYRNYLGTLRRNGLVDVNGDQVKAGEALFLSAAV